MSVAAAENKAMWWVSRIVSWVLHPMLIPFYMAVLLLHTDALTPYLTLNVKRYMLSVVLVNTFFIPIISIIMFKILRVIPSYSLRTRSERILPLFIVFCSYCVCTWMLSDLGSYFLMRKFMVAATACVAFALVVNMFWQISVPMTAMGGASGALGVLMMGGYYQLLVPFCVDVVLAGMLGTARMYLGKHTLGQIGAGFFGSAFIASFVILITL